MPDLINVMQEYTGDLPNNHVDFDVGAERLFVQMYFEGKILQYLSDQREVAPEI